MSERLLNYLEASSDATSSDAVASSEATSAGAATSDATSDATTSDATTSEAASEAGASAALSPPHAAKNKDIRAAANSDFFMIIPSILF